MGCKGKSNVFRAIVLGEWTLKHIFDYAFGDLALFWHQYKCFHQLVYHTKSYCIAYANTHFAHQIISYSIFKHSFSHQSILCSTCEQSFITPNHIILHMWTYILHTKAYRVGTCGHSFSHQGISHGTYEHSFPHRSISRCTRKHSYFTPTRIITIGSSSEFTGVSELWCMSLVRNVSCRPFFHQVWGA